MNIISKLIKLELAAVVGIVAYWLYKDEREERERKTVANLSKDELLKIVLVDPKYRDDYMLYRTVLGEDEAADFIVRDWLIRNGFSCYRN